MKFYYPYKVNNYYDVAEVESDGAINYRIIKSDNHYYFLHYSGSDILLYENKERAWREAFKLMNDRINECFKGREIMEKIYKKWESGE